MAEPVSSFAFMKLLETRASRYDRGMRLLSFGRITGYYRSVAGRVPPGGDVLEIGCGTGGVTAELVRRGCRVTAVDRSAQMLAVAAAKPDLAAADGRLRLLPLPITGLDRALRAGSFDYIVCCLVLSELTATEERYALEACSRLLRAGGTLVIADEVLPAATWRRLVYHLTRLPVVALAYLLTQTTTSHVGDLDEKLRRCGLQVVEHSRPDASFGIIVGKKP